jgi:hypothetical protein
MKKNINTFLDKLSEFLAQRKGLLPLLGVLLVVINYLLQFFPAAGWVAETDLLLHLGILLAILGILVAWAL